jgi:hypothetical protein
MNLPRPLAVASRLSRLFLPCALLLLAAGCATPQLAPQPGAIVFTELEPVGSEATVDVLLAPGTDGVVTLEFRRQEHVTSREVQYREKWIVRDLRDPKWPQDFTLVPGEHIRVIGPTRTLAQAAEPLRGASVRVAGFQAALDDAGRFRDTDEVLLRLLDRTHPGDNAEITVPVAPAGFPERTLVFTRRALLESLGVSTLAPGGTSGAGLRGSVRIEPAAPRPGSAARLTVTVENAGTRPAARVTASLFSRHAWFNGLHFPLGQLAPGETRSFSRRLAVPATAAPGEAVHGVVSVWTVDSGAVLNADERLELPVDLTVAGP